MNLVEESSTRLNIRDLHQGTRVVLTNLDKEIPHENDTLGPHPVTDSVVAEGREVDMQSAVYLESIACQRHRYPRISARESWSASEYLFVRRFVRSREANRSCQRCLATNSMTITST